MSRDSHPLQWAAIIAMKPLTEAKGRLALPPLEKAELAVAMLKDTLAAVGSCLAVRQMLVVTADEGLGAVARRATAEVLTERFPGDLNRSFRWAAEQVRNRDDALSLAFLPADLPALTSAELDLALKRGGRFAFTALSDHHGTGTVLLTQAAGTHAAFHFGAESYRAHCLAGAQAISGLGLRGLRCDVDTLADLTAAHRIGLGRHTSEHADPLIALAGSHRDEYGRQRKW